MRGSTFQYLIAGMLSLAWTWMLGRPLLLGALKKSRRNSIGYFREQQAALASAGEFIEPQRSVWERRPRPISTWLGQPVESRRLQLLIGSAMATFSTLLLAIAVKGMFWSLFAVSLVGFGIYVSFAAYVGASRLRHHEAQSRVRHQAVVTAEQQRRSQIAEAIVESSPSSFEQQSIFNQRSLFGGELEIEVPADDSEDEFMVDLPSELVDHSDTDTDNVADEIDYQASEVDTELAEKFDEGFEADERVEEEPVAVDSSFFDPIPEFSMAPLDVNAIVAEVVETRYSNDGKFPADFTPDPTSEIQIDHLEASDRVSKPLRPKSASRAIYIESQLDDSAEQRKAVND